MEGASLAEIISYPFIGMMALSDALVACGPTDLLASSKTLHTKSPGKNTLLLIA